MLGFGLQEVIDSSISQLVVLTKLWCEGMTNYNDYFPLCEQYYSGIFFLQVIKNNLNPVWRPFKISLNSLCYSDMDKSIKVVYLKCVYESTH